MRMRFTRPIRRITAAAVIAVAAVLSVSAAPAHAAPVTGDAGIACDLGPNCHGWWVEVRNATEEPLYYIAAPVGNVIDYTAVIPPGQKGRVHGLTSIFGGPADMDFYYGFDGALSSAVHFTAWTRFGTPGMECQRVAGPLLCDVIQPDMSQEIVVRIH